MFRALNTVITIGRDAERPLLSYSGMTRFIPNWATLAPSARPITPENPFRKTLSAGFVAGLSGNLGFTHDPEIVFEAARLLKDQPEIHFLLSGWGIGFGRLKQLQAEAKLANVTFMALVSEPEAGVALTVVDNGLGWVAKPGRADLLADAIRVASRSDADAMAGRAVKAVAQFDRTVAMTPMPA